MRLSDYEILMCEEEEERVLRIEGTLEYDFIEALIFLGLQ